MAFWLFVAIVVAAIVFVKQHKKIEELKNRMQDLDNKLYYNYHLMQNLLNNNPQNPNVRQEQQNHSGEYTAGRQNTAQQTNVRRPTNPVCQQSFPKDIGTEQNTYQVPFSVRLGSIESVTRPTTVKGPVPPSSVQVPLEPNHVPRTTVQAASAESRVPNQPLQVRVEPNRVPRTTVQAASAENTVPRQTSQTRGEFNRNPRSAVQSPSEQNRVLKPIYSQTNNAAYSHPVSPSVNQAANQLSNKMGVQPNKLKTESAKNDKTHNTDKRSIESWLGSHVFNMIASLLIFIGLICLGTLVYEYLTDTIKIIAMYLISGGIVALGTVLTKKHRSYFSLGLAGCGCGALFISVLLTHIYFNAISDIAAFSMLIVWTGFTLFISKKVDSVLLSVTAHAGMAISVCFAFSFGFSQTRIILPVIYQIVSIAVIIIGNIFCCKKTYRFGLMMSMCLLVYSSIVMNVTISNSAQTLGGLSVGATAILFAVQTIGISFISYLLSVSTTKLYEDKEKVYDAKIPITLHVVNKLVWSAGMFISVGNVLHTILRDAFGINNHVYPLAAVCVVMAIHLAITIFISEKLNFNEILSNISIWNNSLFISLLLIIQCLFRESLHGVPFIFAYAAVVILIIKLTKNTKLNHLVTCLLSCDILFMTVYGYKSLIDANLTVLCVAYLILSCAVIFFHWFSQSAESRENRFMLFKTIEYLWVSLSAVLIVNYALNEIGVSVSLIVLSIINILVYIFKYGVGKENYLDYIIKVETILVMYTSFSEMANAVPTESENYSLFMIVRLMLILFCVALFTCTAIDSVKRKSTFWELFTSFTFACFVTGLCVGLSDVLSVAYVYKEILHCREFFFVFAVAGLVMYKITKNNNISPYIIGSLGIDAVLMLVFGYRDLAQANLAVLCVIYLVVTCVMAFIIWHGQTEEIRQKMLLPLKTIEYLWVGFSSVVIINCVLDDIGMSVALIALAVLNILAYIFKYKGKEENYLGIIIKIESYIILYVSFLEMLKTISPTQDNSILLFVIRIILILLCAVLFAYTTVDFIKPQATYRQLFTSLTFTCFVTAFCAGFSNVLSVAYVYSEVLSGRPFFFVFAASSLVIFILTKNKELNLFVLSLMGIDALTMVTFGYKDLIKANSISSIDNPIHINLTFVCFIYLAVTCAMLFCLWYKQTEELKKAMLLPLKTVGYIWLSLSLAEIILLSVGKMRLPITLIVVSIVNVLAYVLKYVGNEKNYLNAIVRVTSFITLYICFIEFLFRINPSADNYILQYAVRILLVMLCAAVYLCAGRKLINSNVILYQIFMGLTFTIFVNTVCKGLSSILTIAYVFSIICMVTALICVIVGFILQAKGLRLYGLLVIILCVLKLVTIDISSANSISRVIAFIVGGIICFAISGIYNRFERIYGAKSVSEK